MMTETRGTPYLRQKKLVFEQKAVPTIGAVFPNGDHPLPASLTNPFKTACSDSIILKQALKWVWSACSRAF
jgi:hypothetical protein